MDQADRSSMKAEILAAVNRSYQHLEIRTMTKSTSVLFVGIDVSKGYADLRAINHARTVIAKGRYDDTSAGHTQVRTIIDDWRAQHPEGTILVGVEASGGYERNWVRMLRSLGTHVTVATLNPLAVHRFLARELHRSVTDARSAAGIAEYLASGERLHQLRSDPALEGAQDLYHIICASIEQMSQTKNRLHSLLPRVQPELIQFMRDDVPQWVPAVLERYPTAPQLARAKAETLARIPYVTAARAKELIAAARQSVGAQTDTFSATTVAFLAKELIHQRDAIDKLKSTLADAIKDDIGFRVIESIPGIGRWSALSLRIEIGLIDRFPSPEALTAYAGLDPRYHQSGDGLHTYHISKHGRRRIRSILYMCALSAISANPVIAAFYNQLVTAGKPKMVALTAAMRKLLHLVYACWISDTPFDPEYERKKQEQRSRKVDTAEKADSGRTNEDGSTIAVMHVTAPVSRREAKKRKAAAVPQTRIKRVMRGPGAASRS